MPLNLIIGMWKGRYHYPAILSLPLDKKKPPGWDGCGFYSIRLGDNQRGTFFM